MKSIYIAIVCIAFFQFSMNNEAIAQTSTDTLSPFSIKIEVTAKGAKLICYNGCNWENDSYENQGTILIDSNGVSQIKEVDPTIPFGFTIEKKANAMVLVSKKGTKWDVLQIPCVDLGCGFQVNQFGLVL